MNKTNSNYLNLMKSFLFLHSTIYSRNICDYQHTSTVTVFVQIVEENLVRHLLWSYSALFKTVKLELYGKNRMR